MSQSTALVAREATTLTRTHRPSPSTRLLTCAVAAGPLFVVAALIQVFTRPGFNITRQALSLLTIGSGGWQQSSNFIVTGGLFIAAAAGARSVLRGGTGSRWVPLLLAIVGIGFVGGGVFHPDPSNGFPAGAPLGNTAVSSWHGVLHLAFGSAAFLALTAVCFVLAQVFSARREAGWTTCSRVAGVVCAAGILSGGAPAGTLTLFIGVSAALLWLAAACALVIADQNTVARVAATNQRAISPRQ